MSHRVPDRQRWFRIALVFVTLASWAAGLWPSSAAHAADAAGADLEQGFCQPRDADKP